MLIFTDSRDEIFQYVKTLLNNDSSFEATIALSGLAQPGPEITLIPDLQPSNFTQTESNNESDGSSLHGLGIKTFDEVEVGQGWGNDVQLVVSETEIRNHSRASSTEEILVSNGFDHSVPEVSLSSNLAPSITTGQNGHSPPVEEQQRLLDSNFTEERRDRVADLSTHRNRAPTPEDSIHDTPSIESRSPSIFDTSQSMRSAASTPITSPATSRRPTLQPPTSRASTSRASSSRTSISEAPTTSSTASQPSRSRKFASFAKALKPRLTSTSIYDNPYAAAYR